MKITIEKGETGYRLIGPNGEEGELTEYGEPTTLEIDGNTYFALLPSEEEEYEELGSLVYCLEDCETEVVEWTSKRATSRKRLKRRFFDLAER